MSESTFFIQPWDSVFWGAVILGEFLLLAVLGFLFQQLLMWEARLHDNREMWLNRLVQGRQQMRSTRRKLSGLEAKLVPALLVSRSDLLRKLMIGRFIYRMLTARKAARS